MLRKRLAIVSFSVLVSAGGCARSQMQTAGDPFLNPSPSAAAVASSASPSASAPRTASNSMPGQWTSPTTSAGDRPTGLADTRGPVSHQTINRAAPSRSDDPFQVPEEPLLSGKKPSSPLTRTAAREPADPELEVASLPGGGQPPSEQAAQASKPLGESAAARGSAAPFPSESGDVRSPMASHGPQTPDDEVDEVNPFAQPRGPKKPLAPRFATRPASAVAALNGASAEPNPFADFEPGARTPEAKRPSGSTARGAAAPPFDPASTLPDDPAAGDLELVEEPKPETPGRVRLEDRLVHQTSYARDPADARPSQPGWKRRATPTDAAP